jgi:hypothetical protein
MEFGVLACHCEFETLLSRGDLERITIHPLLSYLSKPYINFVCPFCGLCSQYNVDDIPRRTLERPALAGRTLLHADLKCEGDNCQTRATVHTIPDETNTKPQKPAESWQVSHVHCPSAHALKQPPEVTATRITS